MNVEQGEMFAGWLSERMRARTFIAVFCFASNALMMDGWIDC